MPVHLVGGYWSIAKCWLEFLRINSLIPVEVWQRFSRKNSRQFDKSQQPIALI
jgi:hypothetical protein